MREGARRGRGTTRTDETRKWDEGTSGEVEGNGDDVVKWFVLYRRYIPQTRPGLPPNSVPRNL